MTKEQFKFEYGDLLNLSSKTWDLPKYGITGYNVGDTSSAFVQVSLKGEIDKDSLYYALNGYIYELDVSFLKPDLLDNCEKIQKGNLKAIKVPFKYLTKLDISSMFLLKEKTMMKEVMTDIAMEDLLITWKTNDLEIQPEVKIELKQEEIKTNRLISKEDFISEVDKHLLNIKNILLPKKNNINNWDSIFKKTAMRKQKSVLSVCDGFLDRDLEKYYDLLSLLSINDNISKEIDENEELQNEIEEVFNSIINWFVLQKFQMLKQVRAKI